MTTDDVAAGIRRHIARFWPDSPQQEFTWDLGPVADRLPGFRVRRVAPTRPQDPWVYLTVGAWSATTSEHAEFFLLAAAESPRHVETLAMAAFFHADPRLGLTIGRHVDIGRPWAEGAAASHLLVALPYPYGPALEHCSAGGHDIQFRWLVPITTSEARYIDERGVDSFEELLEESDVDVIDPTRIAVA